MTDAPKDTELPLPTRVAVLEAKVRLISNALKSAAALIVSAVVAYIAAKW